MVTAAQVTELIARLGGLAILAGTLAGVGAVVYRWYVRERLPRGVGLLFGLTGVALYLNTTAALGQVIGGAAPTETEVALFNITAFLAGTGGATLGQWAGDRAGVDLFLGAGPTDVETDAGPLVRSVGRVVAVDLPQAIDDAVGYDPVPAETRETLAGKTFLFPRRIGVDALRERLVDRLKSDYGVGHVDIELAANGSVEYLALGSRAAGIGPTLPPSTNAVAIRADPAFAANAGDLVQVWETDPMRRVLTAELRGVAEDTVTIAIDAADTQKVDPTREYRLVTLPVEDRPGREFASLLRAADETVSSITVEAGSPLHGLPVGALDVAVVAVEPDGESPLALPDSDTLLAPGDAVFTIARPDALRRLDTAGEPLDPALASEPTPSRTATDADTAAGPEPPDQPDAAVSTRPDGVEDQQPEPQANATETAATAESDPGPTTDGSDPTVEAASDDAATDETVDFDSPAAAESDTGGRTDTPGKADSSSFQQLKAEFESGEADWAAGEAGGDDDGVSPEGSADDAAGSDTDDGSGDDERDDPTGLDFGDGDGGDGFDFDDEEHDDDLPNLGFDDDGDDDLSSLDFDDGDDDLTGLDFGDGDDEGLSFEEGVEDGDADADDGDDDTDDNSGGGGATSFQQLKEEFESGEADWEDDISDSPGGDMRLDE